MSGFQRDFIPLAESRGGAFGGVWGKAPHTVGRSAKGEFQNSPVDCLKEVIPHSVGKCRKATKGTARSAPCKRGRSFETYHFSQTFV